MSATFSATVRTPSSYGALRLTDSGDLVYAAQANKEEEALKPCCPFCPHVCKPRQHEIMPQTLTHTNVRSPEGKHFRRVCTNMCVCLPQLASADIMGALRTGCQLQVLHMPMTKVKGAERRVLKRTPWIEFDSQEDAAHAQKCIQQAHCWGAQASSRNLLVLLNPVSGQGRSKAMWNSVKQYICDAAGISCNVIESRGPRDFEKVVSEMDLTHVSGIVVCGGDGTAHEVLQGLLGRPDWASVARIPLAQIPSGSGNALCASLRISDPEHAAFVIIKGVSHPLDAATVLQGTKRRYSFLTLTAGLLSNLDYGTNHLRWMGELRFTLGALYEIMAKRTSQVRVKYLPKDALDTAVKPAVDWELAAPQENRLAACTPPHGPTCGVLQSIPDVDMSNAPESIASKGNLPRWRDIGATSVQLLVACNIPWISTSYHLAPPARLDDGGYTLMWTTESSRLQGIDFLLKSEKGEHMSLPFLHCEKVAAVLFEPISTDSWVLVDGELADMCATYVEVHEGLLNVMVDLHALGVPDTAAARSGV